MANNQSRPPRRGPMGPGMGPGVGEKAKDFKSAVKRLVKELGKFKKIVEIDIYNHVTSHTVGNFCICFLNTYIINKE